ncbi:LysE family translocator [Vibrio mangrovi]|uniref:Homoserine/homoserine lactone efflux protein n=1 Tax=Vibrio mangrovi TaxID=474394 RepID=A0A1Y6IMC3_9VIBR|nr:LysE family translocator [Vibrio mangrovi]MDW6004387.1 LysE family translocator [Vibrio mangrovi]SMR98814.1 Homoserine/homoserine lactone efflux protein [Vibrio mangrovi]
MPFHQWIMFLMVVAALIALPGPSSLLCMTHGARYGSKKALAAIVGGCMAALTLMGLSVLGVGAILQASTTLFLVLKLAGAAYLIYLGISAWRSAPVQLEVPDECVETRFFSVWQGMKAGYMVGIGNPKDLLFFGALFPQFIDTTSAVVPQLSILAATWLVLDFSLMFAYAVAGKSIARFLSRLGGGKLFNRLSGSAFILSGGAVAMASR